jgi:putative membrane protein
MNYITSTLDEFEREPMIVTFFTWLTTALSLLLVDLVVPGVNIATFPAALIAAISIGFVNSIIKPVLSQLSLPLNYLSLGLFSIVVNGVSFWLAAVLVPGFSVHGWLAAILGPIVLSFVNTFLSKYLAERNPKYLTGKNSDLKIEG